MPDQNRQPPRTGTFHFSSPRYTCRPLGFHDDLDALCRWVADKNVMTALNNRPRQLSRQEMAAYVRGFDGQVRAIIGIFAKDAAKLVGVLLLEISQVHRAIRVSFFIGEADHRRRGAMSEVLVALAAHVFAETPIEKLGAVVASDNEASRRTLLASGFHEEATLKSEIISTATNTRLDQHFFAILKPEA